MIGGSKPPPYHGNCLTLQFASGKDNPMPQKTDLIPKPRAQFLCDTAGSILSIHVRGEIDHHTAAGIRQGIDATLFEKRPKKLILDLSAVSFMDSSGLGLIMGRYSVMKELGGEMTVWNPSPETRSILTLAGMERLVKIEYPPGNRPQDSRPAGTRPAGTYPQETASLRGSRSGTSPARAASSRPSPRRRKKSTGEIAVASRKEKEA